MVSIRSNLPPIAAGLIVALTGCAGAAGSVAPAQSLPARAPANGTFTPLVGLFIADDTDDYVRVLQNGTWKGLGQIEYGVSVPDGNWVDSRDNFFQTDTAGASVAEFGFNESYPKFVYRGFADPVVVTTDINSNIFVGDFNFGTNGSITQFEDGHSKPLRKCSAPGGVEGVAVDSNNDVFVAYDDSKGQGRIERFSGGLAGCNASTLGVKLGLTGGLVLDGHHDLIVADQTSHVVDVIEPPYTQVGKNFNLGVVFQPYRLALNRKESRLFVCEKPHQFVDVLEYPSGKLLISLGQEHLFSAPRGVTDEPNAVF
ncbi:MAG: hypothetical protein JO263_12645 [Candidatus Eremiobacteraeota bacterium]|nr:hypothetical protein [Candidatus Eremiobacteraeota bacterium]